MAEASTPQLLVLLLHGYARTARDMASLAAAIRAAGHQPLSVQLPTTFGDLDDCLASLDRQVGARLHQQLQAGGEYAVVAHSLGGLIARHWLAARATAPAPRALLCIATPHRGSGLADRALQWPLLGRLLPPLGVLRGGAEHPQFPPPRRFRIGVMAGDSARGLGRQLLEGPNDGRVTVASALAADADAARVLPLDHHAIHHHPDTLAAVCRFLIGGPL